TAVLARRYISSSPTGRVNQNSAPATPASPVVSKVALNHARRASGTAFFRSFFFATAPRRVRAASRSVSSAGRFVPRPVIRRGADGAVRSREGGHVGGLGNAEIGQLERVVLEDHQV